MKISVQGKISKDIVVACLNRTLDDLYDTLEAYKEGSTPLSPSKVEEKEESIQRYEGLRKRVMDDNVSDDDYVLLTYVMKEISTKMKLSADRIKDTAYEVDNQIETILEYLSFAEKNKEHGLTLHK